jgi:hypothetical protein
MTVEDQIREIMLSEELPDTEKLEQLHALIPADACEIDVFTKPSQPVSIPARPHFFKQNSQEDTVIFPTGPWSRWHPTFAIRKSDSNTLRKVLEKRVDAGENRRAQKTKAMPRTLTIVLMTNPSRGSAFYFRRRDGEHYDGLFNRCRGILTWTHYEILQIA